jgi:uncharacterized membrane protein
VKKFFLYLMIVFYVVAGINHFINTPLYIRIMPPWLPYPSALVYVSGIAEIAFGLLLIFRVTRRAAAWLVIALLVAVFPANIQMALNYWHGHDPQLWVSIVRLPLQILLIGWAYIYAKRPVI